MLVVGVDLSGPTNYADTVAVALQSTGNQLHCLETLFGADDHTLLARTTCWLEQSEVVIGLDAPLSYNVGGGDRRGDARLREKIVAVGLHSGSVMTPTMTRMAYLTLRGISVSRMLLSIPARKPKIVEVHPSATMALRGGPIRSIRKFKHQPSARHELLLWLQEQGLQGITQQLSPTDHYVAACASALAAWKWALGKPVWIEEKSPPIHPFDYVC